jgi:hypothetical protein
LRAVNNFNTRSQLAEFGQSESLSHASDVYSGAIHDSNLSIKELCSSHGDELDALGMYILTCRGNLTSTCDPVEDLEVSSSCMSTSLSFIEENKCKVTPSEWGLPKISTCPWRRVYLK